MDISIPERIAARIEWLLVGATAAGWNVYRDRDNALTREESPAILVELMDEQTETLGGGHTPWAVTVERNVVSVLVTICVRSAQWQTVADGVRVAAHALLSGDDDLRQLGVLRRRRCEWRPASTDVPFGYASQLYEITTATQGRDITALAR